MNKDSNVKKEYTMVACMLLLWGFIGLNRVGIAFLFPILVPLFHMSYFQAGLLISGTSVLWAVSSWVGGNMADRLGRKKVLIPSMIFAGMMAALMGIAWNFTSMLTVRGLLGVGDGTGWSVGNSMVAEGSAPSRRGLNMGLYSGGYTLVGAGLGAIIITRLSASIGWRWVFPLVGAATVIVAIVIALVVKEKDRGDATRKAVPIWEVFKYRPMIYLIILNCLILTWLQVSVGFNPLFLTKVRHLSPVLAGSVLSGWGIAGFAGQMVLPAISDVIGRKKIIIVSALIASLIYWVYITSNISPALLAVLISASGFFGWGQLSLAMATVVSETVPERLHGTAIGVANFFGVIVGTTVMPAVGGWAAGVWGLSTPLIIAAAAMLLVAFIMIAVPETAPRRGKFGGGGLRADLGD